ncbi:MAG: winged helix-turn-helix transcriptional regulator [Sphingomonas sp.]|uniref:ArsR/SmtB family transcription factor n=1 Tax=Sphingomonas sp. TaxID=28214 RepID=UPI001844070A|nr:metalloregulator ArsR/SmtB family transcription factor [Sphingomonas sp.]MBA3667512.1 winged helix-turn-helix transcriptional regulator [Sphingomonas sp.]
MTYQNVLAALSDPMRRTILERVVETPRSVGEIAQGLPISRPAVSQHLKVLKDAELVREERAGTRRIYRADGAALGELRAYIDEMWQAALGSFSEAATKGAQDG